jgi:hypothetical protein
MPNKIDGKMVEKKSLLHHFSLIKDICKGHTIFPEQIIGYQAIVGSLLSR